MIARPFVKWAGGKRSLVPELLKRVPARFGNYFEPFVGGGALFFALRSNEAFAFKRARLGDLNEDLVTAYRVVRGDPDALIRKLKPMKNDLKFFLRMRAKYPHGGTDVDIAARFIYLNKTCFNGLWRVNRSGQFNVPFGSYKNPVICDVENLKACAIALKKTMIVAEKFESVLKRAEPDDFVYFDPPYLPVSATSNFTAYTSGGFGVEDHRRLRDVALALKKRGVRVLISNSGAPIVRELYSSPDFIVDEVQGARSIHADGSKRGAVGDLLIR